MTARKADGRKRPKRRTGGTRLVARKRGRLERLTTYKRMKRRRPHQVPADLPPRVVDAFADRVYLNVPELSNAMQLSRPTVRRYIDRGMLPFRLIGVGNRRKHRLFTLQDVKVLWRRISAEGAKPGEVM